ncbi:hypothetical protein CMV_025340 [Castanea mollissima]|uniref:Uncharacterized protein n=1 Tax=Castanea mollissima TaxID=60419 RepID=A0A8J4QEP4_9ROSI|nr:hypothetical protein CMV_025340 [Castanea mollissima]
MCLHHGPPHIFLFRFRPIFTESNLHYTTLHGRQIQIPLLQISLSIPGIRFPPPVDIERERETLTNHSFTEFHNNFSSSKLSRAWCCC